MADRPGNPLVELTRARFFEFARRPGAVFWVFGFPILLALGLGLAFRERPPEQSVVGFTGEGAAALATRIGEPDGLKISTMTAAEAEDALAHGHVDVVVTIGAPGAELLYQYDPDQPRAKVARLAIDYEIQRALGRQDVAKVRDARVVERGSRYIDFLIPGLIGLNLMGSALWGIGFAVVTARTDKLLKRFAVTPMQRPHFLFAFFGSRLIFLTIQVAALILIGVFVFDMAIVGSWLSLAAVAGFGALAFGGIALLIAARPRSVEAAQGWMNFVQLPMWVLSGSFFSYERFPDAVHPLLRALPLTALNDALRNVINDGAPLSASLVELAVMTAWGIVTFIVALRIFRWQ